MPEMQIIFFHSMSLLGDRKNNPVLQKAGIIGGATAAVLGLLALKYPDRAIFDEHREGIPYTKGWPLVGILPTLVANKERIHHMFLEGFELSDSLTS